MSNPLHRAHIYAKNVLEAHRNGDINALREYTLLAKETDFPARDIEANESPEDYILRVAELDYEDVIYQGAVFQEIGNRVMGQHFIHQVESLPSHPFNPHP